jgi:saccharopine dehydrogenase-like NADP-dependent oxidoreductase
MKACLRVQAHYLDLFSSPLELAGVSREETIEAQLELDSDFKSACITAFPSVGITPGWTSIAAQHIIETMDTVDSVLLRWADWWDSDVFIAPISPYVIFYEWFGPPYPLRIKDNCPQSVDLLESQEEYEFPMPVGKRTIYTVTAHPDIVLIPKFAGKPIGLVEEKGGIIIGPWSTKDLWVHAIREQTAKHPSTEMINMLELFGETFLPPDRFKKAYDNRQIRDGAIAVSVEVNGAQNGHPVKHTAYYVSTMSESLKQLPWAAHPVYGTMGGVPLELVLMLGRKEFTQHGVVGLANFENPKAMFRRLQMRGHILREKIERPMGFQE